MTFPSLPGQPFAPLPLAGAPTMPVAIDYPAALALRQMALEHGDYPQYLLAVEVVALLHYIPDLYQHSLIATLWNSGARINEALALTRAHFSLQGPYPYVSLATLKQRQASAQRGAGAPPKKEPVRRLVPLSDPQYVNLLHSLFATFKIPLAPRDKSGRALPAEPIWRVTDRTVRSWLNDAVARAAADGVQFSLPVSPKTLRHSYAMHLLYGGVPLKVLQGLMGHKSLKSTEVYTKVFALDVAAQQRVQFSMPGAEAVAILKGRR
ncbi:tyrosine-type recombinase/integrase [Serratia nevei]|uniref:tyrosine-type recombinase/integrase n=1 Tax=Serratia nevei TaxID=2703794 RepID=UPI003FA7EC78